MTPTATVCPACRDTGWVLVDADGGSVAKRCRCFLDKQAKVLFDRANIPSRYQKCSLDNYFLYDPHNNSLKDALKISRKFVEEYPGQEIGLLFIGPCGVGKTHLAVAILRELIRTKGAHGLFYDFRELIRDIQNSYTPDAAVSGSDILAPVFDSDLLVLDELGARRSSAWVEETVFYIINNRYNRKKLTLFTSNFLNIDAEEDRRLPPFKKNGFFKQGDDTLVDRIGVRLRSRIYEMCKIVDMTGEDFRIKIKQGDFRSK